MIKLPHELAGDKASQPQCPRRPRAGRAWPSPPPDGNVVPFPLLTAVAQGGPVNRVLFHHSWGTEATTIARSMDTTWGAWTPPLPAVMGRSPASSTEEGLPGRLDPYLQLAVARGGTPFLLEQYKRKPDKVGGFSKVHFYNRMKVCPHFNLKNPLSYQEPGRAQSELKKKSNAKVMDMLGWSDKGFRVVLP